jgi:hypothetical protein
MAPTSSENVARIQIDQHHLRRGRPRDKFPIAGVLLYALLVLKTPKSSHVRFEQFSETCPIQSRSDRIAEGSEKRSIAGDHFSAPIEKNSKGQGAQSRPSALSIPHAA